MLKKINFRGSDYFIHKIKYPDNKNTCIILDPNEQLINNEDLYVVSVNLDLGEPFLDFIPFDVNKLPMYLMSDLIEMEVLAAPTHQVKSGFVTYPLCKVLI
ncbi:hypothetical protein PUW24_00515 (plasmid) [Paenibacillus urinalis]|uniref:Uncharacterized protein n=1 Tax=Paenibacillus urinalis TaxID=521520 RepID=A0AAX3N6M8_9BACL|nr:MULTISPECIES: hypothetical protein [Paenibacillus]MCM3131096.1 hypothetical protein [Paenibacillus sp. MER 78]WDH85318.1 hypothetical protein PUW23_26135 [Paenibacillus urinalis]WDH95074.1 hypothetical protein PUW24_00515 [Paenibacillus urinalis]WDI05281.1 hypothetical protein PUW25_27050 [Paenibacillus urinalis]